MTWAEAARDVIEVVVIGAVLLAGFDALPWQRKKP